MQKVSVRQATDDDCAAILECLRKAFEPFKSQYTPAAYQDTVPSASGMQRRLQDMSVLVAVDEDRRITGSVAYRIQNDEGHLRGMAVSPEFQGRGVAKLLLERVEAELVAQGCRLCTLDTTAPLQRAIRFYERNGYTRKPETADLFGMQLFEYVKNI